MPQVTRIVEAIQPGKALGISEGGGRMRIQLISPGEGSGGFYSAEMLQQAAADRVFAEGCQMFLDHPGETESYDRPERTLRDLAAVLLEDANWDNELQALVAEAKVYKPFAETLAEMKDDIGVSIRAYAETSARKPGQSPNIDKITEAVSVDFVTRAGRGGKILEVLESARVPQIAARAVEAGVEEATARDTADAIRTALRDTYSGERQYAYLLDYDQTHVWFEHATPDGESLYEVEYSIDGQLAVTFTSEPIEVRIETTYVPVNQPAGQSTNESLKEDPTMTEIPDKELTSLRESAAREATASAERDRLKRQLAEAQARESAGPIVDRLLAESDLDARSGRVVRGAVRAEVNEAGEFDKAAFEKTVTEAITAEAAAVAAEAEANGAGKVAGVGGGEGKGKGITESEFNRRLGLKKGA